MSLVIPSRNEGDNLRATVRSLLDATPELHEIVVIDNGSTDQSSAFMEESPDPRVRLFKVDRPLGVARARNFGAERADGEIVVFVDAHMTFSPGWLAPLIEMLQRERVGIVAPGVNVRGRSDLTGYGMRWRDAGLNVEWLPRQAAEPYAIPLAAGGCLAVRYDTFRSLGSFDPGMLTYGSEDLELSLRAWLFGFHVVMIPQVVVTHEFRSHHPYQVDWPHVLYNQLRLIYAHFESDRIGRVLAAMHRQPGFQEAFDLLHASDIWTRRDSFEQRRAHPPAWFFDRFTMPV